MLPLVLTEAPVALNKLYSDHQHAVMLGARSDDPAERVLHRSAAARIARQIGETQHTLDAPAAPAWQRLAAAGERGE